jgi:DNA-binding response OmpR family regulator
MRALVVTTDPVLITTFSETSSEFGIELQSNNDFQNLFETLRETKYEGIVFDFDTVPTALPAIADVRKKVGSHNAVIFAIATDSEQRDRALLAGAHFVLQRPLQKPELLDTLTAAYDLMQRERRRYFRCSAELPIFLKRLTSGETVECSTTNLSSDGVGIKTPTTFTLAESVDISLPLGDTFVVRASGIVIWDDKHGKAGLKFACRTPEIRHGLDAWLDSRFANELPSRET